MLKLAVTADIHINNWMEYSELDKYGLPDRLKLYNNLANDFLSFSHTIGADISIIAGDISNSSIQRPMVLDVIRNFLSIISEDVPTIITNGNHDLDTKDSSISSMNSILNTLSDELPNLFYYNKLTEIDSASICKNKESYKIIVKPWESETIIPDKKGDIFITHEILSGCSNFDGYMFKNGMDSSELFNKYRLSILGHIHNGQVFTKKDRKILIPGCPIQNSYKDSSIPGFWEVTLDKDNVECKFHNINEINPNTYHQFLYCDNVSSIQNDNKLIHYRVKNRVKKVKDTKSESFSIKSNREIITESALKIIDESKLNSSDLTKKLMLEIIENTPDSTNRSMNQFIIKELSIKNFISIDELTLNFEDLGTTTAVIGQNGSGKTTIAEAIYWCLTGGTTKGCSVSDVKNTNTRGDVNVSVTITSLSNNYIISRSRSQGKPLLKIIIENKDGSKTTISRSSVKETQDEIYDILGLTDWEIRVLLYFSAENHILFNNLGKSDKNSLISRLIGSTEVDLMREVAKIKKENTQLEVSKLRGKLESLNSILSINKSKLVSLNNNNSDIIKYDELINDISKLEIKIEEKKFDINLICDDNTKNDELLVSITDKLSVIHKSLYTKRNELILLNNLLTNKIQEYNKADKGICPTCNSKLSDDSLKTQLLEEINKIKVDISKINISELENEEVILNDQYKIIQDKISYSKKLNNELNSLVCETNNLRANLQQIKVSEDKGIKDHLITEITCLNNEILSISVNIESVENELDIYNFLTNKLFKRDGQLVQSLNNRAILYLQEEINNVLTGIDEFGIEICDDLSIKARLGNISRSYELLSKGQSRLVDITLMVSLNNIFSKLYCLDKGILGISIFDEILSFLDEKYVDIAKSILDQLITNKVLIITHDNRLMNSFDSKILVTINKGISEYKLL